MTGQLQQARYGQTATLLDDNTVLIVGGSSDDISLGTTNGIAAVEAYDPNIGAFLPLGPMPSGRYGHSTLIVGGIVDGTTLSSSMIVTKP